MQPDELIEECARIIEPLQFGNTKPSAEAHRKARAVLAAVRKVLSEPDERCVEATTLAQYIHFAASHEREPIWDKEHKEIKDRWLAHVREAIPAMLAASPLGEIEQ